MSERSTCLQCGKDVAVTADGTFRVHGPKDDRCVGSSKAIRFTEQPTISDLRIQGTLERALVSKPESRNSSDTNGDHAWGSVPDPTYKPREGYNPDCPYCDQDMHRCPGCGEPLTHSVKVCDDCLRQTLTDARNNIEVTAKSFISDHPLPPQSFETVLQHSQDQVAASVSVPEPEPARDTPSGPRAAPATPEITAARLATEEQRRVAAADAIAARRRPVKPAWTGAQELASLGATAIMGRDEVVAAAIELVRHGSVSCDIETEGVGVAARYVKSITFSDAPDGRMAIVLDPRDARQAKLTTWIFDNATELIFHNAAFDVPPLAINGLFKVSHAAKVTCTLIYARLAEPANTVPKSLAACVKRYLGINFDEKGMIDAGKAVGMKSKEQVFREMDLDRPIYARGAAADAITTARLRTHVRQAAWERITTGHPFADWGVTGDEAVYLLEREQRLNRMTLRRTVKGTRVDLEYNDQFNARHAQRIEETAKLLTSHGIRPTNAQDLLAVLERAKAIPADYPRTKKTEALSGAKNDLEKLVHPLVTEFIWHKEQSHILHDYLEKIRDLAVTRDGEDWVHPTVNYLGATTGRQSIGTPPLHQFPEGARGVILADPGRSLTSIDWSQIEPVYAANIAGQVDVLERYESGDMDFYDVLAETTGLPRKQNKTQLLGTLYGQGFELTAAKLGVDLDRAREIKDAVFHPIPKVLEMTYTLRQIADEYRMIPTVSGRIVPVPMGMFNGRPSVATHKGVNYHVQGSAYDILADAAICIEEAGLGDAVYLFMHDETVCDTEAAPDIRAIMQTPSERFCARAGRRPVLRTDMEEMGPRWAKV